MPAYPLPQSLGELRNNNQFSEAGIKTRNVKDELRSNLIARLQTHETMSPASSALKTQSSRRSSTPYFRGRPSFRSACAARPRAASSAC